MVAVVTFITGWEKQQANSATIEVDEAIIVERGDLQLTRKDR